MTVRARIDALRQLMKKHGLAAYLIPSTDPHQSEYVPACWQRRPWISGFTGSAGDVLVTQRDGGLWTDGRYFLQAEMELKGTGLRLFRMGEKGVPTIAEFLAKTLKKKEAVGVDPRLLSLSRAQALEEALAERGAKLKLLDRNLVDALWDDQPELPTEPIQVQSSRFAGETVAKKLGRLRQKMKEQDASVHVLTTLDAIAWLLNIRGRDVEFNPMVISYAIVTAKRCELFVRPEKVTPRLRTALKRYVTFHDYEDFAKALRKIAGRKPTVWVDGSTVSRWVVDLLGDCPLVTDPSPVYVMKAKKNQVEMEGMRACHVRDGVAMVRFLRWLEEEVPKGKVTEISAATRLAEFRAEGEGFQGLSFETISGYAEHGAIIHYAVDEKSNARLRPRGIYLIDSGGQYLDGTTDITRTVLLGKKATREQRDRFTRVLQGHIALSRVRFPAGVRGMRLDTLARLPLWEAGLDYNHGTGHGVGSYLNVHEGPQAISPARCTGVPLEEGNVQSNEPGFYQDGAYGIRIENLILAVRDQKLSRNGSTFLEFETLTQCPIDTRLVDARMLSPVEREWLNGYHRNVRRVLGPHLSAADRRWLKAACAPI
jgi:Xaa-Pro aminopeptidase